MKNRSYPMSLEIFEKRIDLLIMKFHNGSGRPTRVSHQEF